MIDHAARIVNVVKSEIGQQAPVDKMCFGYSVSQAFGPYINPSTNEQEVGPGWLVTISMKSNLAPFNSVPLQVTVPGMIPPDEAFRYAAKMIIERLRSDAEEASRVTA